MTFKDARSSAKRSGLRDRYLDRNASVSVELVLVITIAVIGLIAAAATVRDSAISEFSDVALTTNNMNQSLIYQGATSRSASVSGSDFVDDSDSSDGPEDPENDFGSGIMLTAPIGEGDLVGSDDGTGDDDDDGGDDADDEHGTPADGMLVSVNFDDGAADAPFNLQVRNTTGSPTNWRAVIPAAPYATIPGLVSGPYTIRTTPNGDGTFQHVFTGSGTVNSFQTVTITGGIPVPPGVGGAANVQLYIP